MPAAPMRIFSGVKPTGDLHLGNYLGAIKQFVARQHNGESLYCIVDLHAVTVWQNPADLPRQTREIAAAYLAAGIDPAHAIVFVQSHVPEHAELGWLLNCVARVGWLSRMTQFKDKAGKDRERASVGLYVYPTLMAADILAYRATHVPVGEDQKQHLELARDIAQKFNTDFAESITAGGHPTEFFPLPEPIIEGPATRVMSLRDATKKMSKSDASDAATIYLADDTDAIAKKIRRATTDPGSFPASAEEMAGRAEVSNLIGIYAALAGEPQEAVLTQFGGGEFRPFKEALAELAAARLGPIADEMRRLLAAPDHIDAVLAAGATRARAIAGPIWRDTKAVVGFLPAA